MEPADWQRVKAICADALECDATERELVVAVRCGEDAELRREVLRLLAAHERAAPGFLERPTGGPLGSRPSRQPQGARQSAPLKAGEPGARSERGERTQALGDGSDANWQLGSYRVVQKIGEGGMGQVYEAIQEEPVRRRVALKLIKPGMTDHQMLKRFEAERQALALMSHSSIARVYDAGQSEDGRLFFAMEFVQGVPITHYCDRLRLATRERLELFIRVCDAVQHAHQKGIIHRDLKPSNVLVAVEDGRPVPKVIDFGVAKATTQSLTDQPLRTVMGQIIGTLEYMSPEQADLAGLDIDTRSDVYSLGMLLYELLIGTLPYDWKKLRESGFDAMHESIQSAEAPLPSARFATLGPDSEAAAEQRGTRPADLVQKLRGDLDWIVMRALDKDRTRRYQTARELALDLRRHLNHEPVTACPPSPFYRARKFVRRHRLGVAAAGVVVATLILAIVGTTTGLVRARRAEAVAREAEGRATREAEAAKQVSGFLQDLFEVSDPGEARGNTITARELLDRGAEKIVSDLEGQPATQAQLQATIGTVYFNLGLYGDARDLLEKSLEVRRRLLGEDHLDVAQALWDLGHVEQASGDLARAERLFREALRIRARELGELHPETGRALSGLAGIYWIQGQFGKATEVMERVVRIHESNLGPDDPILARALYNLALCLREAGRSDEALVALERARRIQEAALGTDHPDVAAMLNSLAIVHRDLGSERRAEELYREALSISERVLGDRHPAVARQLNNLAILLMEAGRHDEAEPLFERCLAVRQEVLGPDHHEVAISMNDLGVLYSLQGRYEEAEPMLERALRAQERVRGSDHPFVADALRDLGNLYRLTGRSEAAEPLLRRAMAIWERNPDNPELVDVPNQLAALLRDMGRVGEAEAIAARVVAE